MPFFTPATVYRGAMQWPPFPVGPTPDVAALLLDDDPTALFTRVPLADHEASMLPDEPTHPDDAPALPPRVRDCPLPSGAWRCRTWTADVYPGAELATVAATFAGLRAVAGECVTLRTRYVHGDGAPVVFAIDAYRVPGAAAPAHSDAWMEARARIAAETAEDAGDQDETLPERRVA